MGLSVFLGDWESSAVLLIVLALPLLVSFAFFCNDFHRDRRDPDLIIIIPESGAGSTS